MAEFQKVAKERNRMCEQYNTCISCPLIKLQEHHDGNTMCRALAFQYPEEAERIIMQWASEHPVMTNRKKFAEVFGFNIAAMFEVNRGNAEWLDEEYKGGDGNDS